MITYSSGAGIAEGDDDFVQVIYFKIPSSNSDSLYIRILDADCGGSRDARYGGVWDSETRFRLFGGNGANHAAVVKTATPSTDDLNSGLMLAEEIFAVNPFRDNRWYNFAHFSPSAGDSVRGYRVFKITVEGLSCNDGNVFDIKVSRSAHRNLPPAGLKMYSYSPTIRLPQEGVHGEIRFELPIDAEDIIIHNFDCGGGPNPTHVFTEPGRFLVTLTVTGDQIGECNNNDQDDLIVIVHEAPIARFVSPALVSLGMPVAFDASTSASSSSNIDFFRWDFGDGKYAEGEITEHIYTKSGRYVVTLTVSTDSGTDCNSTSTNTLISVNESPVAVAGVDQLIGSNQIIQFSGADSRDDDGVIAVYSWDFGDGNVASGVQVRHIYEQSGVYNVILKVTDDTPLSNNWMLDSLKVIVNSAPVPQIECRQIACVDETINFSAGSSTDSDGVITHYRWNFGDGEEGVGIKTSHEYFRPSVYQATLSVDDGQGVSNSQIETTVTIIINYPPRAEAGKDQRVLPNSPVKFDGSASKDIDGKIIDYLWDFGDGTTGSGAKLSHTYKQPGLYDVILTVTDDSQTNCSISEASCQIRVNVLPVAVAGADRIAYFGGAHDAVLFDGTGSYDADNDPILYYWDFGMAVAGRDPKYRTPTKKAGITRSNCGCETVQALSSAKAGMI